ncbi:50S ribosomal protein L19 [Candidatus Peregrinibacteria bacterium]|nr:MAG: 50S ribosomal protein L19 [Candidatus Peregrinibacteria bacterium]
MSVRIEDLHQEERKKGMIAFRAGQTVRVHRKIREGDKERVQKFEGLVIGVRNQGNIAATLTVRKIVSGIGVEQVFQVHSPLIEKIELIKEAKVRRAKMYFMRSLRGKAARLRERFFTDEELKQMQAGAEAGDADIEEAIENEKKQQQAVAERGDLGNESESAEEVNEEVTVEDKEEVSSEGVSEGEEEEKK